MFQTNQCIGPVKGTNAQILVTNPLGCWSKLNKSYAISSIDPCM